MILIAGTAEDIRPIARVMFDTRVDVLGNAAALIGRLPYVEVAAAFLSGDGDAALGEYMRLVDAVKPTAVVLPSTGEDCSAAPGGLILGTCALPQNEWAPVEVHPRADHAFRRAQEEWLTNTQKSAAGGEHGVHVHRGLVSTLGAVSGGGLTYQSLVAARAVSLGSDSGLPVCPFRVVSGMAGQVKRLVKWHLISFAVSVCAALEGGEGREVNPFAAVRRL